MSNFLNKTNEAKTTLNIVTAILLLEWYKVLISAQNSSQLQDCVTLLVFLHLYYMYITFRIYKMTIFTELLYMMSCIIHFNPSKRCVLQHANIQMFNVR